MSDVATTPVGWLLGLLDAVGSGPTDKQPAATVRQCPAHEDASPSLSIGEGDNGRALIRCHAGCSWSAILTALTLPSRYLYRPPPIDPAAYARAFITVTFPPLSTRSGRSPQTRGYRLDAIHDYGAHHRVLRYRKGTQKQMFWETHRDGCWLPGLFGTPTSELPLYREPDIRMAIAAGEPIVLCESESSVDAVTKAGIYATTWAGGASSPPERLRHVLAAANVVIVPDHDPAGLACRDRLVALLPHARVVLGEPDEDARDLLARLGRDAFTDLLTPG